MSLISMEFLIFVFAALAVYYLIPGRYQWIWLLGVSYVYYASSGLVYLIFIGYTTLVTMEPRCWLDREKVRLAKWNQ